MERLAKRPALARELGALTLLLLYVGGSVFASVVLALTLWNLPGG